MLPSINPKMNMKRELVNEKAVFIAYPESLDSNSLGLNNVSGNPLMDSLARSVSAKFEEYRQESIEQRKRMFPKRNSPFVKE